MADEQPIDMHAPDTWPPGVRAMHHAHGEIWDAVRGLIAAFEVDTGESFGQTPVPQWRDLPIQHQARFIVENGPSGTAIGLKIQALVEQVNQ